MFWVEIRPGVIIEVYSTCVVYRNLSGDVPEDERLLVRSHLGLVLGDWVMWMPDVCWSTTRETIPHILGFESWDS